MFPTPVVLTVVLALTTPAAAGSANCLKDLQALGHTEGAPGKGTVDSLAGGGGVRTELRTLYQAARLLATRGDDEGCQMIVSRMRDMSVQAQAHATPSPSGVAAALPMQRLEGLVRAQNLIGAEVRNRSDKVLGEVADVVIDPREASVSYVLLGRGAFPGIGDKVVAVPFHKLEATADRNLYVLDVAEDRLTNAPAFDPEDVTQLSAQHQLVDDYWD
jgi:sporulation protein YlmC with PRC-barrel domain